MYVVWQDDVVGCRHNSYTWHRVAPQT